MTKNEFIKSFSYIYDICAEKDKLKRCLELAKIADAAAFKMQQEGMEYARNVAKSDTLIRLQRNTLALTNLLSITNDLVEHIQTEASEIIKSYEAADKAERENRERVIAKLVTKEYHN